MYALCHNITGDFYRISFAGYPYLAKFDTADPESVQDFLFESEDDALSVMEDLRNVLIKNTLGFSDEEVTSMMDLLDALSVVPSSSKRLSFFVS